MQFTKIDINNWTRKEYFDHYFGNTPCTYSMTVKLDISKLKKDGKKLYPTLLYGVTTIINRHEEFRTALDENGQVGVFSEKNRRDSMEREKNAIFLRHGGRFCRNFPQRYR